MAAATSDSTVRRTDLANRRLAAGLAASMLLHGLLLSLQFGLPERAMGELRRFTVILAPPTPNATEPAAPQAVESAATAAAPPETRAPLPPAPSSIASSRGLRLVDIAPPKPPEPKPVARPHKRTAARRISRDRPHPQAHALRERVIASERQTDSFSVQQPDPEAASQRTNDPLALREGAEAGTSTGAGEQEGDVAVAERVPPVPAAQDEEHKLLAEVRQAERERVAAQLRIDQELASRLEDERRRLEAQQQRQVAADEEQRLAAEARVRQDEERQAALALAREQEQQRAAQELARQMEEQQRTAQALARQEEQRAKEAQAREQDRLAAEALARQQEEQRRMAEALALQREQQRLAAEMLAREERRAAEELARQQALQREAQARRLAQERAAQQLLEQQRREADIRQAEQVERELAASREEQLRQAELRRREQERFAAQQEAERQRLAEEAARKLAEQVARRQAEQLAQQRQAQELARQQEALAATQRATVQAEPVVSGALPGGDAGQGLGSGGAGAPSGALARGALGSDLANRARELVRGIGVLGGTPPVARQPEEDRVKRRMVSTGAERDVPLRLYIDSFRQKIERNGTLNGGQLAAERVRVDPLVSVAIRSDGSVEDVLIVRSSGRAELDEAVRRIVRLNARYAVFPPNVAAHYDVIEIRRIWTFANGLKLLEELR